jgi:signal transduction histidine kinase
MEPEVPRAKPSRRTARALSRAEERRARQRAWLRPLGCALIALVVAGTLGGNPRPGLHGQGAGVTAALVVFVAALAAGLAGDPERRPLRFRLVPIVLVGGAGVALAALQPHGATELAGSAAVWMAMARLPLRLGLTLGAAITAGLALAEALSATSTAYSVLATTLLCLLLALMARFMRQARESQERSELLLAELQEARDAQAEAAAVAERSRIAGELHDVLAHSLSGAAIQLEAARMLAERDGGDRALRDAVTRAGQLVREGLADARRAVSALRGGELPTAAEIESLVESFNRDMNLEATLRVEGSVRPLPADSELALYRGAQEALTNVARYAPGAQTTVVLRYSDECVTLTVDDRHEGSQATLLVGAGGGRGLAGMSERVGRAGGRMEAGPTSDGWRVRLEVPA